MYLVAALKKSSYLVHSLKSSNILVRIMTSQTKDDTYSVSGKASVGTEKSAVFLYSENLDLENYGC